MDVKMVSKVMVSVDNSMEAFGSVINDWSSLQDTPNKTKKVAIVTNRLRIIQPVILEDKYPF